jgi:hypothetical protein
MALQHPQQPSPASALTTQLVPAPTDIFEVVEGRRMMIGCIRAHARHNVSLDRRFGVPAAALAHLGQDVAQVELRTAGSSQDVSDGEKDLVA